MRNLSEDLFNLVNQTSLDLKAIKNCLVEMESKDPFLLKTLQKNNIPILNFAFDKHKSDPVLSDLLFLLVEHGADIDVQTTEVTPPNYFGFGGSQKTIKFYDTIYSANLILAKSLKDKANERNIELTHQRDLKKQEQDEKQAKDRADLIIDEILRGNTDILDKEIAQDKNALLKLNHQQQTRLVHAAVDMKDVKVVNLITTFTPTLLLRKNSKGQTPFIKLVITGDYDLVTKLLADVTVIPYLDVDHKDGDGFSAIHYAVTYNNEKIIRLFNEKHSILNFNIKDKKGNTPLLLALKRGHFKIAQLLIGYKQVSLHETNDLSESALHLAVLRLAYEDITRAILKRNPSLINEPNSEGIAPIHNAIGRNQMFYTLITQFKEQNINVDVPDSKGITPLIYCAELLGGDLQKDAVYVTHAEKLMELGANPLNISDDGRSAFFIAIQKINIDMIVSIKKYYPDVVNKPLRGFSNFPVLPIHVPQIARMKLKSNINYNRNIFIESIDDKAMVLVNASRNIATIPPDVADLNRQMIRFLKLQLRTLEKYLRPETEWDKLLKWIFSRKTEILAILTPGALAIMKRYYRFGNIINDFRLINNNKIASLIFSSSVSSVLYYFYVNLNAIPPVPYQIELPKTWSSDIEEKESDSIEEELEEENQSLDFIQTSAATRHVDTQWISFGAQALSLLTNGFTYLGRFSTNHASQLPLKKVPTVKVLSSTTVGDDKFSERARLPKHEKIDYSSDLNISGVAVQSTLMLTLWKGCQMLSRFWNHKTQDQPCFETEIEREELVKRYGHNLYVQIYFKMTQSDLDTQADIDQALENLDKRELKQLEHLYWSEQAQKRNSFKELPENLREVIMDYAESAYDFVRKQNEFSEGALKLFVYAEECVSTGHSSFFCQNPDYNTSKRIDVHNFPHKVAETELLTTECRLLLK